MKKIVYIILLSLVGCLTKKTNNVPIYLENNSDLDSVINIKTFVNGKFYKVVPVKRSFTVVSFERFIIELPVKMDSVILTFGISDTGDSTSCVLDRKKMRPGTWVHVNFNEIIFKKGSRYLGQILRSDTLMGRKFYSEIITK